MFPNIAAKICYFHPASLLPLVMDRRMRACCQKQQLHSNIAAFTNSLASTQMTSLATLRLNPTNQQFASICSHLSQVYLSTTSVWSSVYSKDHVGNKQSKNNTNFEVKAGAHKKLGLGSVLVGGLPHRVYI